jgi:hypothetical protein
MKFERAKVAIQIANETGCHLDLLTRFKVDDETIFSEGSSHRDTLLLLQKAHLVEKLKLPKVGFGFEEKKSGGMLRERSRWAILREEDINAIIAMSSLETVLEDIENQRYSIIPLVHLLLLIGELLHLLLATVRIGRVKINQVHFSSDPPNLLLKLSIIIMLIEPSDRSQNENSAAPSVFDDLNFIRNFIKYYKYPKECIPFIPNNKT